MLLSLNWMRDYFAKADLKVDTKELADGLTMRGIHVAAIRRPNSLESVVVAKIVKIEKHPNADRLQVTQCLLSDAPDAKPVQIVCGAKNIAEGDIVPVATPGAVLPGDLHIKVSTIRGVESNGMICSGKELGLSTDGEGILQLSKQAHIGHPLTRLLGGQDDTLFEFELTPNRGDCLSILGLAREAASLLDTKLREPKQIKFKVSAHRTSSIVNLVVDDAKVCPRYVARVIDNLKVQDSPEWIKQRLQAIGMKPINNIVDVTNFCMMEFGQPLHAFDLRKLQSGGVRVGAANFHNELELLNGEKVVIEPGDIVIWDGDRPVALAGIMGGKSTEVTAETTSILLESAAFDPTQIRKTAKRLGLVTDSSKRFEKGTDLGAVLFASDRAASILRDSMNGNVYHPPIDTNEEGAKETTIALDMREVRKILGGADFAAENVAQQLESIGITSHKKSPNILSVKIPTHRIDIKEAIDIIEEAARLIGYNRIKETMPISRGMFVRADESSYEMEMKVKRLLTHFGLRETIHYSFVPEDHFKKYGIDPEGAVELKNPLSDEMKVMRKSLLPSLIQSYIYNKNRKQANQRLFEVAHTYELNPELENKVSESVSAAGLFSGTVTPAHWTGTAKPVDFYFVKGLVETLLSELTTVTVAFEKPKSSTLFHPNRSAALKLGLKEIGYVGEVHPFIADTYLEATEPVFLFEINLEALRKFERTSIRYKTPSKFPGVELDIAIVVDKSTSNHNLTENIKHSGGSLLTQVSVFDVYEGKGIPDNKKSLAYHLMFQSNEKTLLDTEITELKEKIIRNLGERYGAQLRT
jgi:phenylalanyl-tRNA synthetase beta chain